MDDQAQSKSGQGVSQGISSRHEQLVDERRAQLATGAQTLKLVRTAAPKQYNTYLYATGIVAACTLIASLVHHKIDQANLIMIYLLGITVVATLLGKGRAVYASVLSIVVYDYFFVPPYF